MDRQSGFASEPVFGLILFGGAVTGALVRDIRLANELASRGFRVHVWWAMDVVRRRDLDSRIAQRVLFHGARYSGRPAWLRELGGLVSNRVFSDDRRSEVIQNSPRIIQNVMLRLAALMCDGVERDAAVIDRFAAQLDEAGVTHLLPSLGMLALWAEAARGRMRRPPRCLVTFQGHEVYMQYAQRLGRQEELKAKLRDAVDASDWPAVAVSDPYRRLLMSDIGLREEQVVTIHPGVPFPPSIMTRPEAIEALRPVFPHVRTDTPLVSFMARQDADKGVDLLIYAARILQERKRHFHLLICGPTLFGKEYRRGCEELSRQLLVPYHGAKAIHGQLWSALLTASHCVAYPSVVRETFGLVPVEAMAHGTPAVVSDYGGVGTVVEQGGRTGGVRFRPWDSGDLADKIDMLLTDRQAWERLAGAARDVAAGFSVPRMADRVLQHMGLPLRAGCVAPSEPTP